jgi:basic membrane protein A and related proteins
MSPRRLGFFALVSAVLLSGCGASHAAAPVLTPLPTPAAHRPLVALVTDIGGLRDRSFNAEAWRGLLRARAALGVNIVVRPSRSVNDYYPLLAQMANSHVALVVAIGSTMATAVYAAANKFPHQRFALVDARPQSTPGHEVNMRNVVNLLFDEQQAGFLAGAVAGLIEVHHVGGARHNTIGWIGGAEIPQVTRYVAGFEAGARHVDPGIKILGTFAGSFDNPAVGRQDAQQQARAGADLLFHFPPPPGAAYLQAAQGLGKYGIGVDTDQSYLGGRIVTSAVKRVDVAVYDTIRAVLRGRFHPYDRRYGIEQGGAGITPPSSAVPQSIVKAVDGLSQQIARGHIHVPSTLAAAS